MPAKRILLVDDSTDDLELAQRLLAKVRSDLLVSIAHDGVEALALLLPEGRPGLAPDLILLDLKMPRLDGTDVLKALRADPRTQAIPVVMFSSSSERGDREQCYALGANSYLRKSVNFVAYEAALRLVVAYWIDLNETAG